MELKSGSVDMILGCGGAMKQVAETKFDLPCAEQDFGAKIESGSTSVIFLDFPSDLADPLPCRRQYLALQMRIKL